MSLTRSPDAGAAGHVSGPLAAVAVPPADGLIQPWWLVGETRELRVTVVAKVALVIVPEGPMTLAEPEGIVTAEIHHANSPARSVRLTPEIAPRVAQCDVILAGHACAPEGQAVRWMPVRLAVFRDRALVDKTLYVYGDEAGKASFDRIPLVYERAYGGLGFRENPLGTGILELASRPNLVHPERAEDVACFAPISRTWPSRRRLIGGPERKAADAPVPEIREGFDWSYFQVAPIDQRIDRLHGDEWVVLEGMSATMPRVRSRLPSVRAEARVYGLPNMPDGTPIALTADTLRIDADRMGCWLVWRADFVVPHEDMLSAMRVIVGVETETAPIAWPEARSISDADAGVIELDSDALVPIATVTIDDGSAPPAEVTKPVVPFVVNAPQIVAPALAGARLAPVARAKFGDTIAVTEDEPAASTPFVRMMPAAPPPQWSPMPIEISAPAVPEIEIASPVVKRAAAHGPSSPQGIRLNAPPSLALAVVPWGPDLARDCFAVIVKASCDLVPGEPAVLRSEADPISGAAAADDESGARPSDLAPYKTRADVVVKGRAYAPSGEATTMEVALAFGHEGSAIQRRIKVFGDRRWQRGTAGLTPSSPEKFSTMPIVYERAFGGAGFAANPMGRGIVDRFRDAQNLPSLPNLEDPDALVRVPSMRPPPASFSPLPRARAEASPTGPRRAPWPFFGEDIDWSAHQIAAPAQRLPFLRGDEPFAITGMHRAPGTLEGTLPGVAPRAFASRPGDRFEEIPMHLDTVVIDPEARAITLVWRGVLLVESEAQPDVEAVHVALEKVGKEGMTIDAARAKFARE